jgi:hypothetical protein
MRFSDRQVILDLIERTGSRFSVTYLPNQFINDKEMILKILQYQTPWEDDILKKWSDDSDVILAFCKYGYYYFEYASDRLKDHLDTVLKAIDFGVGLKDFSERLRNHPMVIEKILALNPRGNIHHLSPDMINQKEFIIKHIENRNIYVSHLFYDYPMWKNDPDIALEILKSIDPHDSDSCYDFKNLADEFRDDIDFVKIAIAKKSSHFEYISDRLKDDLEIVKLAIRKNWRLIQHASTRCQQDSAIMAFTKELIEKESKLRYEDIESLPYSYQEDDALYLLMMSKCPKDINDDIDLGELDCRIKIDLKIATAQIKRCWFSFADVSPKIQADDELYGIFKTQFIEYLYQERGHLYDELERTSWDCLQNIERCRNDLEVMIAAGCARYDLLNYLGGELKSNKELALATVKTNWIAIHFLDPKFQQDEEIYKIIKNQLLMQFKNQTLIPVDEAVLDFKLYGFKRLFEDKELMSLALKKDWTLINLV